MRMPGIGHEIRNPMTTVRGFLQLLGGKKECAQFNRYYELMIEELDRANSIITEFLSLAKKKTLSKKAQNLNPIVGALLPLIQADATRAEKYVKTTLGDTPDLLLDEKEIRQLILNLVRNGLEAMSPGGYINIRTYLNGKNVVLAVDDQGKGIDPEVLENHNLKLQKKFRAIEENEKRVEVFNCEDADIIITAFGTVGRIIKNVISMGAKEGIKIGLIRPISLWPFPSDTIEKYSSVPKAFLDVELNAGQMIQDVKLALNGANKVHFHGRMGGMIPTQKEILDKVKSILADGGGI